MHIGRLLLGCALVAGTATACAGRGVMPPPRGDHALITARELERADDPTLYDAVRRLRPHMLRNRTGQGRPATRALMLYVDGKRMDGVDDLRRFGPRSAEEVRFMEPQIANVHFASYNNSGGAIAVRLKKQLD